MQFPNFPMPVAEEIFYSVIARHLSRSAGSRSQQLKMLGCGSTIADPVVPKRILSLSGSMQASHSWSDPQYIVENHSLVPLYLHFAQRDLARSSTQAVCSEATGNPSATVGITIRNLKTLRGQKFCPDCLADDIARRGFPVIYRDHQAPFVKVCVLHRRSLLWSCRTCQLGQFSRSASMWQMAGCCSCEAPDMPPVCDLSSDPRLLDNLVWVASQTRAILSNTAGHPESWAEVLFHKLRAKGYGAGCGLDSEAIKLGIAKRFGEASLAELGVAYLVSTQASNWSARFFGKPVLTGQRIPDVLRALLLVGLAVDDIEKLWDCYSPFSVLSQKAIQLAKGYKEKLNALGRSSLPPEKILEAFVASQGRWLPASKLLGVSIAELHTDVSRHKLRFALAEEVVGKIGASKVDSIRVMLRNGVPRNEIKSTHKIGAWHLCLIELDDPTLAQAHREATIERQRQAHRAEVSAYMCQHPEASKGDCLAAAPSAYRWLLDYDSDWLLHHGPKRKLRYKPGPSGRRKNWKMIDEQMLQCIADIVQKEYAKQARPTRLTKPYLRQAVHLEVGEVPRKGDRTPKAWRAIEASVERTEEFDRRKVLWSIRRHAGRQEAVSISSLKVEAAVNDKILGMMPFICEWAHKLELAVSGPLLSEAMLAVSGPKLLKRVV